jgi:hypothetical protein
MNLSVLIHTFNRYSFLWEGFIDHWERNWALRYPATYFGTDFFTPPVVDHEIGKHFQPLYSGGGEWSDRLRRLLVQIPSDYILYMQEDHYPFQKPPNLAELGNIVEEKGLFRLQISPVNRFYTLEGSEIPLFFDPNSKYLVSHQPSIWKKSFLLDCLKPGEDPWKNEYEGTKRLQQTSEMREFIRGKIAIYPRDWYKHMCVKGQVVEP